nr:hypothetical protein [Tanacetum cinerariifolium]
VHKPFLFGAFSISKLDELRDIIPKKKNIVVKHLMNSLSRRYERLRQILREHIIQPALPAPEQAPSQTSRRKRKHMELEPETRIPGLECNRTLPENVMFINNMVIEEPDMKLRKFIAEHPDQEKIKSKKVKLEARGYNMDWDKLTSGDKCLDLSAFKLSRLFFRLLSSGSLVVGDHMGFSESIVTTY